ncbi:MAG: hypothetical protein AVDCRST_MAG79-2965, partial [uncultured Thermoleophilia bacterium]
MDLAHKLTARQQEIYDFIREH